MKKHNMNLEELPRDQRIEIAEDLGKKVADIVNKANSKANKLLNKYGYALELKIDFGTLKKD